MSAARRIAAELAVVAAACLAAGCARAPTDAPPVVHFGQDPCAACTMIVSEQRFAAAIVPGDGSRDPLAFDDIGCLLSWERDHPDSPPMARWVRDHEGAGWLRAERAWYVRSVEIRSPMGSGVAALVDEASARAMRSGRGGELTDWDGLRETDARSPLVVQPGSGAAR